MKICVFFHCSVETHKFVTVSKFSQSITEVLKDGLYGTIRGRLFEPPADIDDFVYKRLHLLSGDQLPLPKNQQMVTASFDNTFLILGKIGKDVCIKIAAGQLC